MFLFLSLVVLLGCEGATRLGGKIADRDGHPIEGATIVLDVSGGAWHAQTLSKSDGTYYIHLVHPPGAKRVVTISKFGYKTVQKKLHGAIEIRLDVVLQPETVR